MSLTPPNPPTPLQGNCASGAHFLTFPSMNGPLPAELKFRENTEPGENPGP